MFTKYFAWEPGIKTICRLLLGLVQIQQAAITCHSKGSLNTEQNMKVSHQKSSETTWWQGDWMLTWIRIRSMGWAPRPRKSPLFPRCELRVGWLQELNRQQALTAETSQETLPSQLEDKQDFCVLEIGSPPLCPSPHFSKVPTTLSPSPPQ